jgi:hypothetical protein
MSTAQCTYYERPGRYTNFDTVATCSTTRDHMSKLMDFRLLPDQTTTEGSEVPKSVLACQ